MDMLDCGMWLPIHALGSDGRETKMQLSMMTSSNGNIFRVTGHLCGEFTGPGEFPTQRPVTRSFDVFFYLHLIERLSKHSRGWWFKTLSRPLWHHCNGHGNGESVYPTIGCVYLSQIEKMWRLWEMEARSTTTNIISIREVELKLK